MTTPAEATALAVLADGEWHRGARTFGEGSLSAQGAARLWRAGLAERRGESKGPKPGASGFEYRITTAGAAAIETSSEGQAASALEVLELLADHAAIAAHYLLAHAPKDSHAEGAARSLLVVLRVEVAGVLKDRMPLVCTRCGTGGNRFRLATSARHRRCGPADVIGAER